MSWLEVSVEVKGELAEPVAELFSRYAEGGVALEQAPSREGAPTGENVVTIRAYTTLDDSQSVFKRSIEEGLWHLSQITPLPNPTYRVIPQSDWSETWRQHYNPIPIGSSLLVLPAWVEPPQSDRASIILEPGMAFGTGTHPTSQMCLLAIETYCRPGDLVIDLGCGSGILSIGAIQCGAQSVLAFDIDAQAIASARHNLALNQMSDRIELVQGSLDEALRVAPGTGAPILVANILAPIIIELLHKGLDRLVSAQGYMILSGILDYQLPEVLQIAETYGLQEHDGFEDGDWRAVVLRKR